MTFECDNLSFCHDPITISEDSNSLRVFCRQCKNQYVIKKDWRGVPDNKMYSQIFKKDILQGHEALFYKYYSQYLKI